MKCWHEKELFYSLPSHTLVPRPFLLKISFGMLLLLQVINKCMDGWLVKAWNEASFLRELH